MIDIGIDNSVSFKVYDKITEADVALIVHLMREKTEKYGTIVLLEQVNSFKGVELSAIIEEFRFFHQTGFANISKVAVVTDKKWIETIVGLEDTIFRNIDMRSFSSEDIPLAIQFLH